MFNFILTMDVLKMSGPGGRALSFNKVSFVYSEMRKTQLMKCTFNSMKKVIILRIYSSYFFSDKYILP
jgi:hypothetical protein